MNVQLTILGDPVPYKRERINMRAVQRWLAVRMRGNPYRFGPLTYTPSECKTWQRRIQKLTPKDHTKETGKIGLYATWFRAKPWSDSINRLRPDGDNILKNLKDALQGVVYADDAYVCIEQVTQVFDAKIPMLRVNVRHLGTKEKQIKWVIAPDVKSKLVKAVKARTT